VEAEQENGMRVLRAGKKEFEQYLSQVERRGVQEDIRLEPRVRSIMDEVRRKGDEALLDYTRRFDRVRLSIDQLQVSREEIKKAYKRIPPDFLKTQQKAAHRIRRFHRLLAKRMKAFSEVVDRAENGIRLEQIVRPLERVGIYVPGGKASYPSTVLMAAIPARVVGVREILMVSPPHEDGISPAVLVAADIAGVDRIFRVGGVQAIAALAYGTPSIPKVDKIVGPGNRYVAAAKRCAYGIVDIDMVAGPSEIVIIGDAKAPPSFVAADLISQAEHDEMALAILITPSVQLGQEVAREVKRQLASRRRRRIAWASLMGRGAILIVKDFVQAIEVANRIGPEHLELCIVRPSAMLKRIKHAGAVFLGPYTPEAIGDYLAGPNHILPTAGTARFSSPLGVEDFIKRTNILEFTRPALERFAKDVEEFAAWEGLEGHYRAVQVRMEQR
jgi:histidinol dehydrogenase